jgi:uncharacterized membrane protein YfcA
MEHIIIFAIVGILVGLAKGGLGGPVPIALTVPLLTLIVTAQEAVGLILPLLMFADLFALYFYWNTWSKKHIVLMLLPGLIGVAVGTLVLKDIDETTLKQLIGGFTLAALSFKIVSDRLTTITYTPREWHGWLAGWASGFGSALANMGAPPFTSYLLLQPKITPTSFIGTTTLFFAIINATKLPGFIAIGILDINKLLGIAWVFITIPFAIYGARWIISRMNPQVFEWMMMIPLILLSISLLFFS